MELDEIIKDQVESIGYTLPDTHVSSKFIPIGGSDVIFVNLYTSIPCILHTISVCIIIVCYFPHHSKNKKSDNNSKESNDHAKVSDDHLINKSDDHSKEPQTDVKTFIDQLINDNGYDDLLLGIRITSNTTLFVEVLVRLITIIIWTQNSDDFLGTFLAVWMPNLQLLMVAIALNIVLNIFILKDEGCNLKQCCFKSKSTGLRTFFTLYGTVFILLYHFFPTIILTFAYPTRMIVIFAFVVAYLLATSVFSAGIVKLYKYNQKNKKAKSYQLQCCKHSEDEDKQQIELRGVQNKEQNGQQHSQKEQQNDLKSNEQDDTCCDPCQLLRKMKNFLYYFFLLFMPLWMIILYLHFLMLFALYMLMIGRASVINTGPTFIISLFTPALLSSIAAAILKKSTLIKAPKEESDMHTQSDDTTSKDDESPKHKNFKISSA